MKNIKLILSFVLLFSVSNTFAQIIVNIRQPLPNRLHIEDLWSVGINNLSGNTYSVYLKATVTEAERGVILEAQSSVFNIPTGNYFLKVRDISPICVNYTNTDFDEISWKTGSLPEGVYDYCISVIEISTGQEIAMGCLPQVHSISNTWPPQLLFPMDGTDVCERHPIFSWLPVASTVNNVRYKIKVVQILDGQSATDALSANPLWLVIETKTTILQYPVYARTMLDGERYMWQVEAIDENEIIIGISDINIFNYNSPVSRSHINDVEIIKTIPRDDHQFLHNHGGSNYNGILSNHPVSYENASNIFNDESSVNVDPIKFSGNTKLFTQSSSRRGINSQIPRNLWRWDISTTLAVYGIPINFNAFVSSEQEDIRQNTNMFQLQLNPAQIYHNVSSSDNFIVNFLSLFSKIGIGTCYPTFSALTVSGIPVTGVDIEFTPGKFYLAFTSGRTQKAIEGSVNRLPTYNRKMLAAKIGYGEKQSSHIYLTVSKSYEDENSIERDTLLITPQENYLIGADTKLILFDKVFSLDGEIVLSTLTRDTRSADLETDKIPKWIKNTVHPKVSTSADFAYSINSKLDIPTNTRLGFSYKYIGPGFVTHGAPFLRNDVRAYEVKAEQDILERSIRVKVYYKNSIDNLIPWKQARTTISSYGIGLNFRFKNLPYFQINYSPHFQENDADSSKKVNNKTHLISLTTGYNYKVNDLNASSNIFVSYQENNSLNEQNKYNATTYSFNQTVLFKIPLAISTSISFTDSKYYANKSQIISFDLNGAYTLLDVWVNTFGFNLTNQKDYDKKYGFYFISSFPIVNLLSVELKAEKNIYSDMINTGNDFNELILYATLSKSW